eukprot:1818740-Rhodomonas_salina.1
MGTFKAANGSGTCSACGSGSYQNRTAASGCESCPSNTYSLTGSDDISDCICNVGFEGWDGAACTACSEGTYKLVNGSGACSDCAAG